MRQVLHPTSHWGSDMTSAIDSPPCSLSVLTLRGKFQRRNFPMALRIFPAAAMASALLLAGCDKSSETQQLTAIDAHAAKSGSDLALRQVNDLTARVNELERQVESLKVVAVENAEDDKSLRRQVAQNAQASNQNTLDRMTERGDCGTRTYRPVPRPGVVQPVVAVEKVKCTEKDLRP